MTLSKSGTGRIALARRTLMAATAVAGLSSAALAEPSALVEDISSDRGDVQLMDYLEPGQTVKLAPGEILTLGYFESCVQETITGGTVTVGQYESTVSGGAVETTEVDCDGGPVIVQAGVEQEAGAATFRAAGATTMPVPDRLIFGLSPIIKLSGPANQIVIERLDAETSPKTLAAAGNIVDTAAMGVTLEAGGTYRVTAGDKSLVFKVSKLSQPTGAPAVSRLLPL